MDILPFLDFQFTSKIITQGYRYGQCKTGAKRSGLAAYSQCLPSSQKGKLYRSACFQLVSKLPPLQKQFFIFGKCHWFSYMLSGSDLFIFRICLFSDPIKATNHCGSIYFFSYSSAAYRFLETESIVQPGIILAAYHLSALAGWFLNYRFLNPTPAQLKENLLGFKSSSSGLNVR